MPERWLAAADSLKSIQQKRVKMSKQSKSGGGNMLLLAGIGIGAFMLLSKKSNAQTDASTNTAARSGSADNEIPEAPAILAVNNNSTESPTPTAIVSDEEGMTATSTSQSSSTLSAAPQASYDEEDDAPTASSSVANAGAAIIAQAQSAVRVPAIISTRITPKEQAVVNAGKLTAELALKRPDLYKAAYIKKYGGATQTGKRKALTAATLAIDAAVNAVQANKNGGLVKATKYPAKPQNTFVQTAGGMMAQTALSKIAVVQKAGVKVSPAAQKVAAQVKAAKRTKPKAKPAARKVQPAKKRVQARPAAKARPVRPVAKKQSPKKR